MPPISIAERSPIAPIGKRTLVLCVADCHYGAEWIVRGLRGEILNRYNPEVFGERMDDLLAQVREIIVKENISDVQLLLCGDSLDGMLRNSQLMKLRWGVIESCMRFSEHMAQWIAALSQYATVSVCGVDGNHTETRTLNSKRGDFPGENLEKVIFWFLAERLKGVPGVFVDSVTEQRKHLTVQGFNLLLTHGTDIKSLENAAKQTMLLYGEAIDYLICGHKHREQEYVSGYTDQGNAVVIRVPSLCGMDEFAQRLGYGGKPGALAMVLEAGYGRRCIYPISL
ncbi:MAG: metallophosphoesterase family protein [Oscillospiraceae bacterium]|nr:metallophosphoesterase family protein [Oscillospiraceae bacterium]